MDIPGPWALFVAVVIPLVAVVGGIAFTWLRKLDERQFDLMRNTATRDDLIAMESRIDARLDRMEDHLVRRGSTGL